MERHLTALKGMMDTLGISTDIQDFDNRITAQKTIYLAQRAGWDLGYRFGWYKRGPYSPRLAEDYYDLWAAEKMGTLAADPPPLSPPDGFDLDAVHTVMERPSEVTLTDAEWLELVASLDYLEVVCRYQAGAAQEQIALQKSSLAPWTASAREALHRSGLRRTSA